MIIKVDNKNVFNEDIDDDAYNKLIDEMKSSACFIRLSNLCDKYGYKLFWATKETNKYRSSLDAYEIRIRPNMNYASDIYIDRKFSNDKPVITAQTSAFGSLSVEQYPEFCDAINKTNELIKELYNFNYSDILTI